MNKKKELTAVDIHTQIVSTSAFKLKDGGSNNHQFIDLISEFGYIPRAILIEKVRGKNNVLVVSAVNEEIWKMILKKAGKEVGKDGKLKSSTGAQPGPKQKNTSKRDSG